MFKCKVENCAVLLLHPVGTVKNFQVSLHPRNIVPALLTVVQGRIYAVGLFNINKLMQRM
jgi:hypothetical protein